jgi:hypothetical protein
MLEMIIMTKFGIMPAALLICIGFTLFSLIAPAAVGQRMGPGMMYGYGPGYSTNATGPQAGYGPAYGMTPVMIYEFMPVYSANATGSQAAYRPGYGTSQAPSANIQTEVPWMPDGNITTGEYSRNVVMKASSGSDVMEVYWKNDPQYLYMALRAKTPGWIAIGFEPSVAMKDADMILGYVSDGKATIDDQYSTGTYGPHLNDTQLGGTYDILESGGREDMGFTTIEFKRKMNTGDKFDKAFSPGQNVSAIWSLSGSDSVNVRHTADGKGGLEFS